MKHQAVDKMFWLERGPLNVNTRNVVWLCRPKMEFMNIIAGELNNMWFVHLLLISVPSALSYRANTVSTTEPFSRRTSNLHHFTGAKDN